MGTIGIDNYINARPDGQYAVRILERYRDRAITAIKDRTLGQSEPRLGVTVRELNKRRVAELSKAIDVLKEWRNGETNNKI